MQGLEFNHGLYILIHNFALILKYLKITIERTGKKVKYDPRDMKVFWLIQWALNYYDIVQVGKGTPTDPSALWRILHLLRNCRA
ncbi:hypothetical protein TQ32_00280 [Pyrococcus kukulkanii]|uniref:Uncharacterized protein n=1 Tax=Pyrococcus kukulkanii TaxID=1609559 RepID=A0A127B6U3_9EURY|nr:hypothetical protein TQ32_00280 [Pyrococcus kukulkanii]